MNNPKRNRLKNKQKIKQLKQKLKGCTNAPVVESENVLGFMETISRLQKESQLKTKEIQGLHRFISRANIDYAGLAQSFNCTTPDIVRVLSDGSLDAYRLDEIRFSAYRNHASCEDIYRVGLKAGFGTDVEGSFVVSPLLIQDAPIDYLVEKILKQVLKIRKEELLRKTLQ